MPTPREAASPLPGYSRFEFTAGTIEHSVYFAGSPLDPPLLLMSELSGIAPGLLLFAERLRQAGYCVYMPWLFGPLGRRAPLRNALRLCISREFGNLRAGVSAPITQWLRALASDIGRRHADGNVGVIGMCLTGAFAIPLILDRRVSAAVAAQPSVPLSLLFAAFGRYGGAAAQALNVGDQDIRAARVRLQTGEAQLLAVRCRADRICPPEKIERLQREFPVGLTVRQYGAPQWRNALGARPHALFTKEYRVAPEGERQHPSREAFADLLGFLHRHLRDNSAGQEQATGEQHPGPQR